MFSEKCTDQTHFKSTRKTNKISLNSGNLILFEFCFYLRWDIIEQIISHFCVKTKILPFELKIINLRTNL